MNSRTWYSDPAAPCAAPALIDRSRVAHPGVPEPEPEPPGPPEADADAPPGDEAGAEEGRDVCDPTARGVREGGAEVAGEDAAVPLCPPAVVAGAGDDPGDAVQPAAAATAATAVTIPATRSSSEPEPVIPNHPSSCFAHPMMTPSGWQGLERDYPSP